MARLARVVIAGVAHHVTQRGNRRERVFFGEADYRLYLGLISSAARESGTAVWAYCLMPNHVHFIMVPSHEDGLRATFAQAHRRYTGVIHARESWSGHLWQGRFASTAMDEAHLHAAIRYVDLNPVRAGWRRGRPTGRGRVRGPIWRGATTLSSPWGRCWSGRETSRPTWTNRKTPRASRRCAGRAPPAGRWERRNWLATLETRTKRDLAPRKRGPKPKDAGSQGDQPGLFSALLSN